MDNFNYTNVLNEKFILKDNIFQLQINIENKKFEIENINNKITDQQELLAKNSANLYRLQQDSNFGMCFSFFFSFFPHVHVILYKKIRIYN